MLYFSGIVQRNTDGFLAKHAILALELQLLSAKTTSNTITHQKHIYDVKFHLK